MDEIIEGAVGALHILARDPQNRLIISSNLHQLYHNEVSHILLPVIV